MSFFNQFAFEGKDVDGSEENTVVQQASIIPGGTKAVAMIEEVKWDEYETPDGYVYFHNSVTGETRWAAEFSALLARTMLWRTRTARMHMRMRTIPQLQRAGENWVHRLNIAIAVHPGCA